MKIGILSMQKVINYGSFLQAYGLRKLIKSVYPEEEINFIDIIPGRKLNKNNISKKQKIHNINNAICRGLFFEKLRDKSYMKKLEMQFNNDFFPLLNFTNNVDEKFSTVVIGSDEVFNCTQNAPWGFSTQLLGDIKNVDNIISYAASFGATTLDKIESFDIKNEVITNLKKINKISVRDNNSAEIINDLLNIKPEIFLDPVLLCDYSKEIEESDDINEKQKYMIVYSYTGRIVNKLEIEKIREFAKSKKLKIYTIFCRYKWADKKIIPNSPFQMLKYFKNAEYVVSDTFHGSIFSIISHKKFCTLIRESNKEKMKSLLKMLKIDERAVYSPEMILKILDKKIDYDAVDNIRNNELKKSLKFLKENIR